MSKFLPRAEILRFQVISEPLLYRQMLTRSSTISSFPIKAIIHAVFAVGMSRGLFSILFWSWFSLFLARVPKNASFALAADTIEAGECKFDAAVYCPEKDSGNSSLINCLLTYEDVLSDRCIGMVRTLAMGACNMDAEHFCPNAKSCHEIDSCIIQPSIKLSSMCAINIGRRNKIHTRVHDAYLKERRFTTAITGMSAIYLLIPLIVIAWIVKKSYILHKDQNRFSRTRRLQNEYVQNSSWTAECYDISYWARTQHAPPVQILQQVRIFCASCGSSRDSY